MYSIVIGICFLFSILPLSSTRPTTSGESLSSKNCSTSQIIKIDEQTNQFNTSTDIIEFTSSWQQYQTTKEDSDTSDSSTSTTQINQIQIVFNIPSRISSVSISIKRVFIIDALHNQLLALLNDICLKNSSFTINYSTSKPLPHNVCLNLILNETRQEILFCRTIDPFSNLTSSDSHADDSSHAVGPSGFFILSQCIIILIMMSIIAAVQKARETSLVDRVSRRLVRTRPYKAVFGDKAIVNADGTDGSAVGINPATTLQAGLNLLVLPRLAAIHSPHSMNVPLEEQVLAAADLTATMNDRAATRLHNNRDLIDVKEFTKRLSIPVDNLNETGPHHARI